MLEGCTYSVYYSRHLEPNKIRLSTVKVKRGGKVQRKGMFVGGWQLNLSLRLFSLPADALWGSFVTHSFLPQGRLRGG